MFAAKDNHQITNGSVPPGIERDLLTRMGDVKSAIGNGFDFGTGIESTVFRNTGAFIVGDPGPTKPEWPHPITGLPMSVRPDFYIIEVLEAGLSSASSRSITAVGPVNAGGDQIRARDKFLNQAAMSPAESNELRDTHRLLLSEGRMAVIMTVRP